VRRIRFGQTHSYGELASLVGSPRAARAVGSVMAKNRTPLVVPCHRVLASRGAIGGFSAMDGVHMKRRLLDLEAQAAATFGERRTRRQAVRPQTKVIAASNDARS
jgi:methylated-DNA-[protein]-cysteine S-methyltransferase